MKTEREQRIQAEKKLSSAIHFLLDKEIPIDQIAQILELAPQAV